MSKQAPKIEEEIDKALRKCGSLSAEGLWRRMRYLMEHDSDRRPHARLNGKPVTTPEQLSFATGCSAVKVSKALPRLLAMGLVRESDEGYYSPQVRRILEVRAGAARRKRESVGRKGGERGQVGEGVLPHTLEGVTSQAGNALVTHHPPPMVSPPITPSSLSPSSLSPGEAIEVPESVRRETYAAFDRWSSVSRGYPLEAERDEHRKVAAMLTALAQETPIVRGGEQVGRHLLAAKAADLAKRNGKDFTTVAYACGIVKSELERWETKGIPGATAPKGKANGTPAPRESARGTTVLGRV